MHFVQLKIFEIFIYTCVCVFILFLVRELSECNCCLLARLCVLVKMSTTILDHTITLYFQKGRMQNSLTQPRPLTSDSIIQFSPSTFSPSRRGVGEWIADCSLKPFTFAYERPVNTKYVPFIAYKIRWMGIQKTCPHARPARIDDACVHFRSIGTMMSSMMTKRSTNCSIIDGPEK